MYANALSNVKVLLVLLPNSENLLVHIPRGLGLKIKAERLFPLDKFMSVFSGSRQVNTSRGVYGSDGVKRVVCR